MATHDSTDGQYISCRNSAGRCLIIIHLIAQTSRPVIFIFSYTSRNSFPINSSLFRMIEGMRWVSQWFQSQAADFYDTWYKIWSHNMTNVSIPEVDYVEIRFCFCKRPQGNLLCGRTTRFPLDFYLFKPDEIGKWWHMIFCQMSVILFTRILF